MLSKLVEMAASNRTALAFRLLFFVAITALTSRIATAAPSTEFTAGLKAYGLRDYRTAAECFEKCTSRGDTSASTLLYLGNAYTGLGDRNRAKRNYYAVIQKYPNSAESPAATRLNA